MVIQRASNAVSIIYNDLFSYSRSEFINYLSENYDIKELHYVRDLVVSVVWRRFKQALGPLIECKSGANVKENLLKDIYNIYSLGEGSIQSLPKNMIKIANNSHSQSVQTDSCLSNTIFASKLDLDTLRAELLSKITDIRHEVVKANHTMKPSSVSLQQSQPQQFVPSEPALQQQLNLSSANQPETCPEVNLSDETLAQMPVTSPDEECTADPDDDFLVIQRASNAVSIIYNDLFSYSRSEFINYLSENYDIKELHYVRDLVVSVVWRRFKQARGPLVERKSGANVKENLLKDIYNIYSLGEGSIQSLPNNMIKIANKSQSQSVQTDSCLSNTIFASKLDLDTLRAKLLSKITDIRHEVVKANHTMKPSSVSLQQSQPQQFVPSEPALQQQLNLSSANQPETCPEVNLSDETLAQMPVTSGLVSPTVITSSETQVIQNTHKVLIAGDSLLHHMNASKMKVCDTPSMRLTKRGDSLACTVARIKYCISRHQNVKADLVLLAGTNDLSSHSVSPEFLISSLENSITELEEFSNLQQIFICKIPPRFDFHNVNSKVTRYNVLLEEHFPDSDFVHVLDTVTPEFRHYHTDGLHLSQLGLRKICSIILSKLYKFLNTAISHLRRNIVLPKVLILIPVLNRPMGSSAL